MYKLNSKVNLSWIR